MKAIKFRAWTGGTMKYRLVVGQLGAFYVEALDPKDIACLSPFNTIYSEQTPIMQFTGLKDKNGKEIYEGDVLSITNPLCQIQKARMIGVVEFSWAAFQVEIKRVLEWKSYNVEPPNFMLLVSAGGSKEMAIIGNIHENPELLEK